jgi:hypothetical protein
MHVLLAAALAGLVSIPMTARADASVQHEPIAAQFRGCSSAGWCRFWTEGVRDASQEPLYRVRPDGVAQAPSGNAIAIAVRDRLNVLLSDMIHQNKQIVLHDLRKLDDGTFAAKVTVTGIDVASDPTLLELRERLSGASR